MGMIVQHNINAQIAYNKLNSNVNGLKKASEKLASGYRINRAGDDAAGLAISEKMRSQIRGLGQAVRNAQDGINMIQTYEGAAQETHNILLRMKELATQSANGTYDNSTDRDAIQLEFDQLNDELDQLADTDFNGRLALNGGRTADGSVASNNSIVAGKPTVAKNAVYDPTSDIIYSEGVHGFIDANGNGRVSVDGVMLNFNSGYVEDSEGNASWSSKMQFGDSEFLTGATTDRLEVKNGEVYGKILMRLKYSITEDTDEITLFGEKYQIDKNAAIWHLMNEDNSYITVLDNGARVSVNKNTLTINVFQDYIVNAGVVSTSGMAIPDIGRIEYKSGRVSVPDAYEHGRRNLTFSNTISLQVGARSKDIVDFTFEYVTSGIGDLTADLDISSRGLGTNQLNVRSSEKANEAIDHIDNAINKVSMVRATFGAMQNRLEHKIDNINTTASNLTEAESNIRDTDMANELMSYTKNNILQQSAQSMLAQANQQPQSILQLLG